ncbi:MAG: hypothetical protein QOE35_3185 [Actinomycetota bacterium]|jgi:subtilase family serine protease
MRRLACLGVIAATVLLVLGLDPGVSAADKPAAPPGQAKRTCVAPAAGEAACHAEVSTDANGTPLANQATPLPSAKQPADIQSAYGLPTTATNPPSGPTVAIVDAYNDPAAEADLGVYRARYNLPPCTTANGCFKKVNQRGGTAMPATNAGWATEISLDLDAVSAACPNCKMLLVEADNAFTTSLAAAVDYAASQHPAAISNSYGGPEYSSTFASYNHPGIAITVSSGDSGYGVESPASAGTVIAVGGTSLQKDSSLRGWTETAWSGAGSGCSASTTKPTWQTQSVCARRAVADVAAVADPNSGLSVYDSVKYQRQSGWQQYGGTSLAAPIIAAVYALGGNLGGYPAQWTWGHASGLNDVLSGSNGSCSPAALCKAGVGYDGPTGLGTPNGTSAF